MTVDELLDRYLLDLADHGRTIQVGRVEAWRCALGPALAVDVTRDQLNQICRGWMERGPTWKAGTRKLSDTITTTWKARDPNRRRPLSGASVNRLLAVLSRGYALAEEAFDWRSTLTFPHYDEGERGTYITEDLCRAICANFQARFGAPVKADVFRLAYLTGIRKGRLRNARKRHVLIVGDTWKLRWPKEETKGKKRPHVVVLGEEERAIVQRAWANRLPDCDFLFHVDGKPLGPMRSELERACKLLGIPYGRETPRMASCSTTLATRPSRISARQAPTRPPPCRLPAMSILASTSATAYAAMTFKPTPLRAATPISHGSVARPLRYRPCPGFRRGRGKRPELPARELRHTTTAHRPNSRVVSALIPRKSY